MTDAPIKTRKKLIEVALPLDKINEASAREKSIRHGHPSTLHLWWARRPLAAARAVIFAQMVDDPSEYVDTLLGIPERKREAERELKKRRAAWELLPDDAERGDAPTLEEAAADLERERLFRIIEDLVKWENTTNDYVLDKARAEIWQSWRRACADNAGHPRAAELFDRNKLPAFHDPFAGGGALPLEAQRLGLEAYASDLNPVAVLINKAMIEIPPKFAGQPPVNPEADRNRKWKGAEGLADDVRYYGNWMRDEAEKRIRHLYPKVKVTAEMAADRPDLKPYVGRELTVIAWLWARTVKSPNPAFRDVDVPLASTFMLSTKAGKEAWVEPVIEKGGYRFEVRAGKPRDLEGTKLGTTAGKRAAFKCLMSAGQTPIGYDYIRDEGKAGRMSAKLMAIVAEGSRGRVYLSPTAEEEDLARSAKPDWRPDMPLPDNPRDFKTPNYGLTTFGDLFTDRQLVALNTFSDLVLEAREKAKAHALAAGRSADSTPLDEGGTGAQAYSDAVAVYLGQVVSKLTAYHCTFGLWRANMDKSGRGFGRQAIPMVWDYPEVNPFAGAGGDLSGAVGDAANLITLFPTGQNSRAYQAAAQILDNHSGDLIVSTDPPYYDNIGYADLSDFYYVWLRHTLRDVYGTVLGTIAVPKEQELVATPYRHGGKEAAEAFFLQGMTEAVSRMVQRSHRGFPTTIYYAFKQAEVKGAGAAVSTGWETFLEGVVAAGFALSGTWPMRTEQSAALKTGMNSLASSIVLVCRPRAPSASTATRRQFLAELRDDLPKALLHLQRGNIAPVDLAQAAIGPGMAVFTRYAQVIDGETGKPISVREALARINEVLDEVLARQEGDFDPDTRWAVTWFDEMGFAEGDYGRAEQLSKAKNTSVAAMAEERNGGIILARAGKVRLRRPAELPEDWDPDADPRLTVWEMVHHLIRRMDEGGEGAAAELVAKLGARAETARELAYRLYSIAERKKRAADALPYNALVQSWPEITRLARDLTAAGVAAPAQAELAI